jgi:2-C-methyl-D-erythritol 4-phosphate cytidylyltransferase
VPFPRHGVIITAAGESLRFIQSSSAYTGKKEFVLLDDRSVLYHATEPFISIPGIAVVVVTYGKGQYDETVLALDNLLYTASVPVMLVEGGATRQESVRLALEELYHSGADLEFVAIHDGARPWITSDIIIDTLATASVFGGAAPGVRVHDALKRVDQEGMVVAHPSRDGLVAIQTPQVFRYPLILEAHRQAVVSGKVYLDDTEIFTDAGGKVVVSQGSWVNRKITTSLDLCGQPPIPANPKELPQ